MHISKTNDELEYYISLVVIQRRKFIFVIRWYCAFTLVNTAGIEPHKSHSANHTATTVHPIYM